MDEKTFDALARDVGRETGLPRRTILGGVGGGLALTLSTLLSNLTVTDADAAGAADGSLGGRRGKNRRGRNKHQHHKRHKKKHGSRKSNPPGLGGAPLRNVRVIVENHTKSAFDAEGWVYNGSTSQCQKRYQETIQPNLTPTFVPDKPLAYVWIKGKYLITVQDQDPDEGLPYACINQGGQMSKACYKYDNDDICRLSACKELGVGQQFVVVANACRDRIEIQRDGDAGNELVFRVRIIL